MYALPICVAILGIVCIGASFYHWTHSDNPSAFLEAILVVGGLALLLYGVPATFPEEAPQVEQTETVISEVYIVDQVVDNRDNFIFIAQDGKTVIVPADKVTFEVANGSELVIVNKNDAGEVVDAVFYLTKERMTEY